MLDAPAKRTDLDPLHGGGFWSREVLEANLTGTPATESEHFAAADFCGADVHAVRLRGLPFTATVDDVRAFFGEYVELIADTPNAIWIMTEQYGSHERRPTGSCIVFVRNKAAAHVARRALHSKYLWSRYIEVLPVRQRLDSY